jgi:hypothetical protein
MSTWLKDVKGKHKKKINQHSNGTLTLNMNGELSTSSVGPPEQKQLVGNPKSMNVQQKDKDSKSPLQQPIVKTTHDFKILSEAPLHEIIRKKYNEFQQEQNADLKTLENLLEVHKTQVSQCVARHQRRQKLDLVRDIRRVEDKITNLKNKTFVNDYEKTVLPYFEAYEDNQSFTKLKQNFRSPPTTPKSSTINCTMSETQITQKYLRDVEKVPQPIQCLSDQPCPNPNCNGAILSNSSCDLVCRICGYSTRQMDATASTIGFGDEVEFLIFSYKKINHFNETLNHLQAKESTLVPVEILRKVMEKIYEKRIRDVTEVTYQLVYQTLKDLQLSKYYEQTSQIYSRLTGNPPPRFSSEQEENLRRMFNAIIHVYDKVKPANRVNFLSYSFVLYKCCQLLGYTTFLGYFNLHRGKEKLEVHEQIWKKICGLLNWKFIPCPVGSLTQPTSTATTSAGNANNKPIVYNKK